MSFLSSFGLNKKKSSSSPPLSPPPPSSNINSNINSNSLPFIQQTQNNSFISPQSQLPPQFYQQEYQQELNSSYSSSPFLNELNNQTNIQTNHSLARRIFHSKDDRELPPCAVIVTIFEGGSYDDLYRHTPQISPDPTQTVALFELNYSALDDVLNHLKGERLNSPIQEVILEIMDCISRVDPDSVVFNFECCGSCSEHGFGHGQLNPKATILPLVSILLSHRHVVMFGDFSLKALIHDWDEELLGPNPFMNCGTTSTAMALNFKPEELINCCNAQLQNVGKMCETGHAIVNVMGGTIVFNVLPEKSDTTKYSLEILTRCSNSGYGRDTCGHVMLTYPSGGKLLVSAGHWIELSQLSGATEESVLKMCSAQLGQYQADQMMNELNTCSSAYEREQVIQKNAQQVVWSSAPCKYSAKR